MQYFKSCFWCILIKPDFHHPSANFSSLKISHNTFIDMQQDQCLLWSVLVVCHRPTFVRNLTVNSLLFQTTSQTFVSTYCCLAQSPLSHALNTSFNVFSDALARQLSPMEGFCIKATLPFSRDFLQEHVKQDQEEWTQTKRA